MPLGAWQDYLLLKLRDDYQDALEAQRAHDREVQAAARAALSPRPPPASRLSTEEPLPPLMAYRRGQVSLSALTPSDFLSLDAGSAASTQPTAAAAFATVTRRIATVPAGTGSVPAQRVTTVDSEQLSRCAVRRLCARVALGLPEPPRLYAKPPPLPPLSSSVGLPQPARLAQEGTLRRPENLLDASQNSKRITSMVPVNSHPASSVSPSATAKTDEAAMETDDGGDERVVAFGCSGTSSAGAGGGGWGWGVPWDALTAISATASSVVTVPRLISVPTSTGDWLQHGGSGEHVNSLREAKALQSSLGTVAKARDDLDRPDDVAALLHWADGLDTEWLNRV